MCIFLPIILLRIKLSQNVPVILPKQRPSDFTLDTNLNLKFQHEARY